MNTESRDAKDNVAVASLTPQKVLVVIQDEECCDSIFELLDRNGRDNIVDLMLLNVIEPVFLRDIPWSGAQALSMIQEHRDLVRERTQMLWRLSQKLQIQFPHTKARWQVRSDSDESRALRDVTRDWKPNAVIFFPKARKNVILWPFGGKKSSLPIEGIMKESKYIMVSAL
jgi:hypothetical protein